MNAYAWTVIPWIITIIVGCFTQRIFWKSWIICSLIRAVYYVIAFPYIVSSYFNVPINTPFSLEYVPAMFSNHSVTIDWILWSTFGTWGSFILARFFMWATGSPYWRQDFVS
jgi:hypothetical protein